MKKIAVILCGSGYLDGSEIREAVGVLWALSPHSVEIECFAPDDAQYDVIDHLTGSPAKGESRNMLREAARIARGKIKPLAGLNADAFDAIVMPGGFGAAKNLCTFAIEGAKGKVRPDIAGVLQHVHAAGKPIGAACIAPAVLALTFKGAQFEMTVGETCDASKAIESLGHKHIACAPNEMHWDKQHKIITTPAYMYDNAPLHEIFEGIQKMVDKVVELVGAEESIVAA